jgi:hypothetical protein
MRGENDNEGKVSAKVKTRFKSRSSRPIFKCEIFVAARAAEFKMICKQSSELAGKTEENRITEVN